MKMYFLDFEASSLDKDSYPIEIGWVGEDGQGESYLIQPHWSWKGWSEQSEAVHHITQDMLRAASPVAVVARRAHDVLSNALIISDQPAFEAYWLEMLLKVIDEPPMRVDDIHALIGVEMRRVLLKINAEPNSHEWHRQSRLLLDQAQSLAASVYEGAVTGPTRHRASSDAQDLWRRWRAVCQAIDGMIPCYS